MATSIRTAVLALAMLTLAAVELLPAQADAAPPWTVHLSDLDVNSGAGIQELYRRTQFAAGQVCGEAPHAAGTLVAYYSCRNAALSRAVDDARLPLLTNFDSEQSRQRGLPAPLSALAGMCARPVCGVGGLGAPAFRYQFLAGESRDVRSRRCGVDAAGTRRHAHRSDGLA